MRILLGRSLLTAYCWIIIALFTGAFIIFYVLFEPSLIQRNGSWSSTAAVTRVVCLAAVMCTVYEPCRAAACAGA